GLAICAVFFTLSFSASAQQPKKVARIGYLSPRDAAAESIRVEGIRLAARAWLHRWTELAIEYRYTQGKQDRQPELAADLVRLKVDIIVVSGGTPLIWRPRTRPTRFPSL